MNKIRCIFDHQVYAALKYKDLIPAVRGALEEFSSSVQPLRTVLYMKKNGAFYVMPSYSSKSESLVTKLLSVYPGSDTQPAAFHSYLLLFDTTNGSLSCMICGEAISAMRTAAASAVATQELVTGTPKVLSILGSGRQAKSHLQALSAVYNFEKVKLWSRNPESAKKFCKEMQPIDIVPCSSVEEAVKDADVVVTVTRGSTVPLLREEWLKPGCHINCVGSCKPAEREIDEECMRNSVLYVDSRESAMKESGDIISSKAEIYAEMGEIFLNKKVKKKGQRTIFKSMGLAIEDAAAAKIVMEKVSEEKSAKLANL